jgi:hypothetical protein
MQAFQGQFMFLVCSYRDVYSTILTYACLHIFSYSSALLGLVRYLYPRYVCSETLDPVHATTPSLQTPVPHIGADGLRT